MSDFEPLRLRKLNQNIQEYRSYISDSMHLKFTMILSASLNTEEKEAAISAVLILAREKIQQNSYLPSLNKEFIAFNKILGVHEDNLVSESDVQAAHAIADNVASFVGYANASAKRKENEERQLKAECFVEPKRIVKPVEEKPQTIEVFKPVAKIQADDDKVKRVSDKIKEVRYKQAHAKKMLPCFQELRKKKAIQEQKKVSERMNIKKNSHYNSKNFFDELRKHHEELQHRQAHNLSCSYDDKSDDKAKEEERNNKLTRS